MAADGTPTLLLPDEDGEFYTVKFRVHSDFEVRAVALIGDDPRKVSY